MSNPFDTEKEDLLIKELIELYNNRKRKSMKASPSSLFFLKEGIRIAKLVPIDESNNKPNYKTVFTRIKYEWTILDEYNRIIYIKTAIKLGYKQKDSFTIGKIDQIKSRLSFI